MRFALTADAADTVTYSRTATSLFYAKRMSFVLLGGERTGCHNDSSFPFTEYIGTGHLSAPACAYPHADRCIAQAGR